MKNRKVKIRHVLLIILTLLIAYLTYSAFSIYSFSKQDEKQNADVAIVLGAATYSGEISPVFQERINHGIWLYKNKYVRKIILTGGCGDGNDESDAYIASQYVIEQGVAQKDILLDEKSTTTQENLENSNELMADSNYTSAIIVSDPLHMKRAMLLARDAGIKESYNSPTPTTKYKSFGSQAKFLSREVFFYIGYQVCMVR